MICTTAEERYPFYDPNKQDISRRFFNLPFLLLVDSVIVVKTISNRQNFVLVNKKNYVKLIIIIIIVES